MKKGICFLLAGAMILSQTACSGGETSQPDTQPDSTSETETITTNDNSLNTNDEESEETPEDQSEKEPIDVSEKTPESTEIPQDWVRYEPTEGEVFFLSEEKTGTTEDFEDQYIVTLYDSDAKEVQTIEVNTLDNAPIDNPAFEFMDINSDGYMDVPLITAIGNVNRAYQFYLWNPDDHDLTESDFLGGDNAYVIQSIDTDGSVMASSHNSAAEWDDYYYQWDDRTTYHLVKKVHHLYDKEEEE